MISCTDFIPAYSVLFQYLEDRVGKEGVVKYWEFVSDEYVQPLLGEQTAKDGLEGCWNYWEKCLNEEAADFRMILNLEKQYFEMEIFHCPSKGRLLEMQHMEPYHDYCGHCKILYPRVMEPMGYSYECDHTKVCEAHCKTLVKKLK